VRLLTLLRGLDGIVDGCRGLAVELGVMLDGVEAELVPVRVVQHGQDPADGGELDVGVGIPEGGEPFGEFLESALSGAPIAK
jgi:hypothetical protein